MGSIIVSSPSSQRGDFFLTSLLEEWGVWVKKSSRGEKKKGRETFSSIILEGIDWNFYDPKIKICKINYCENKVKLYNKDNSKNKVNEIMLMKSFLLTWNIFPKLH